MGRWRLYGGLLGGVIAVSWGAIFIRLADAPSLSIAAYRLLLAASPSLLYALLRHRDELRALTRREHGWLFLSGVALALHFATWIASLSLTTVASSVALVSTQPLWVALLALATLRERVTALGAVAILVATAGGALIGGADISVSRDALLGDVLAVAGAIFGAIYFVVGRSVRPTMSLAAYIGVVYSVAAVLLLVSAAVAGQPLWGFSGETWAMFGLLALVPQLIGHSTLNWALRYLSAPFVSVAILGEPVISTALAIPILDERPGLLRIMGGAVTLVGVYLAMRDESRQSAGLAQAPTTAGIPEQVAHGLSASRTASTTSGNKTPDGPRNTADA
jgi:drug/metabolite transporter (DMT)-like permease